MNWLEGLVYDVEDFFTPKSSTDGYSSPLTDAMMYGGDPNGGVSLQGLKGFGKGLVNGTPRMVMGALKVGWESAVLQARQENGDSQDVAWAAARASTANLWDGTVIAPGNDVQEQVGDFWDGMFSPSVYAKGVQLG